MKIADVANTLLAKDRLGVKTVPIDLKAVNAQLLIETLEKKKSLCQSV